MNSYVNLNTVSLYKTPQFNQTDTILFASATERDNYFNSINTFDKLELTEFTDLYEGRQIVLPYNYLDLKRYNTMKLHYDDGLGHVQDYYCNVDNYIYTSTNACVPIYRIDYFLTFGHLLYNKDIDIIMDRRTVKEEEINKNMKADSLTIPRVHYKKYNSWSSPQNEETYYIAFLNKTTGNHGKNGVNCSIGFYETNPSTGYHEIDTYTIGCYLAFVKREHLSDLLNAEPAEYIEKIIEWNVPRSMWGDFTYETVGNVYYVSSDWKISSNADFKQVAIGYDSFISLTYNDIANDIQPTHDKKIMKWLNSKGCVIQGYEFDFKDFDDNDFVIPLNQNNNAYLHSSIYLFNIFGYTFAYPLGYKGESINMDYLIKWQSAKNFSYTSDYINTLAYKEQLEYNNQAVINAQRTANVQAYYANQLAQNANAQLDITKQQTEASYLSQINSLNSSYNQALLTGNQSMNENILNNSLGSNFVGVVSSVLTGSYWKNSAISQSQLLTTQSILDNNLTSLTQQKDILKAQRDLSYQNIELQKQANLISARHQADTAAVARDNAIANIAISNKYNNAKPNAYNQTDFSQYTTYYYIFNIDTDKDTDFTIVDNVRNHYNVLGINVGYLEHYKLNTQKGLYFDYVLGSVVDNSNKLYSEIDTSIYVELLSRIEQGVRMWHLDKLEWFGNMIIDNTYTGTSEPYNELTNDTKRNLESYLNNMIYTDTRNKSYVLNAITSSSYSDIEKQYMTWYVNDLNWGSSTIPTAKALRINGDVYSYFYRLNSNLTDTIKEISNWKFLTIYEMQSGINYAKTLS